MDLRLLILRQINTPLSSIGEWHLNDKVLPNLFSLEDHDRGLVDSMTEAQIAKIKVFGETAVPTTEGTPYQVVIEKSPRFTKKFGRDMFMLHVVDPKGFAGILVHPANNAKELLGCCAPGESKAKNFIGSSRPAYVRLLDLLKDTLGFTYIMVGTMPILAPVAGFVAPGKVYLDIKRNYTL